jgi:multidrug efflux pump subunit AcrB
MEEVSSPVAAVAIILAAVFLPTAFIRGLTGRLYQQFTVTIAISVVFSAFNALTLSPALAALLLKPKKESGRHSYRETARSVIRSRAEERTSAGWPRPGTAAPPPGPRRKAPNPEPTLPR